MKPDEVMLWLQVIGALVQAGKVTFEDIVAAIRSARGQSDADTVAEDDAALVAVRAELARRKALAESDAAGR